MKPAVKEYTVGFSGDEKIDVVVDYRTPSLTSLDFSLIIAACLTAPIEEDTCEILVTSSFAGSLMLETRDKEGELLGRLTHDGSEWVLHS